MKAKNKRKREARQKANWPENWGRWRYWVRYKKSARVSGARSAAF